MKLFKGIVNILRWNFVSRQFCGKIRAYNRAGAFVKMGKAGFLASKYVRYFCEAFCVIFAIGIVVFLIAAMTVMDGSTQYMYDCVEMDTGWKIMHGNGHGEDVVLPVNAAGVPGEVISLENRLPGRLNGNETLAFRTIHQFISVSIDGEQRLRYDDNGGTFFWRKPVSRYIYVTLTPEDAGKTVRIDGISNTGNKRIFTKVFVGEKSAIISGYVYGHLPGIILATTFFALGIVGIVVGIAVRISAARSLYTDALGWAMLIVSVWDFSQSDFRDFLFSEVSVIKAVPPFALLMIPLFISVYFNWLQGNRFFPVHRIYQLICIVTVAVSSILVFTRVLSPDDLVEPAFIFIYSEFAIIIVTAVIDNRENGRIDYMDVLVGCVAVSVGGLIQVFRYYFYPANSDGVYMGVGFAILTLAAVGNALRNVVRIQGEKQAAVTADDIKTQFLATMSHEIRTPINAIMGMNEAILRESNEDHVISYARDVENAGKLLLYLVNDILDFSKLESGKMTLVYAAYSVRQLVIKCYNIIIGKVKEKELTFKVIVDEKVPSVLYGDEVRIQQVIINLLNNAVKYTDSGEVTLKVSGTVNTPETVDLQIEVSDTGRGIKEENLGTLFDAFTRTQDANNSRVEGTGLGLAITSKFVNLMEGTITVRSNYGEGSTFTVEVPQRIISEKPVGRFSVYEGEAVEKPESAAEIIKFPGVKLLVVDDVQLNIKVVMSLLKKAEMEIDSAISGEDCLEKCKVKKYDVILLDHMMPGKDGIQTLWEIRRDRKGINNETPVIMMTANAMNGAREEYMGLGFSDYVSKPFNLTQLQKIIEKNLKNK